MKRIFILIFAVISFSAFSADVWEKQVFAEILFPFSIQEEGVNFDGVEINGFFNGVAFGVTALFFKPQPVFALNMQYMAQFPERTVASYLNPVLQLRLGLLRNDIGFAVGAGAKCFYEFVDYNYAIFTATAFYEASFDDSGFSFELSPGIGGLGFESVLTFGGSVGGTYVLE